VSATIESEPTMNSADFDPTFPELRDFPGDRLLFRVFYRNVAQLYLRAKYGIFRKLHAGIDGLCL